MVQKKVLFICTHNSARSQMAEAFLNKLYGDKYEAYSAGIEPKDINPYVVKAMVEIGIDISRQRSKSIREFWGQNFDYVVTVCDHAKENCPFFPSENVIHKNFEDPAEFRGSEKEIMRKVRQVRDEIKEWIQKTFGR